VELRRGQQNHHPRNDAEIISPVLNCCYVAYAYANKQASLASRTTPHSRQAGSLQQRRGMRPHQKFAQRGAKEIGEIAKRMETNKGGYTCKARV